MQPAMTVLSESTTVCRTLTFIGIVQLSWIKIEVARDRSMQECFQGLSEALGDT